MHCVALCSFFFQSDFCGMNADQRGTDQNERYVRVSLDEQLNQEPSVSYQIVGRESEGIHRQHFLKRLEMTGCVSCHEKKLRSRSLNFAVI